MEYIYGALLLHKVGKEVTAENLTKVIHSTGIEVDASKIKTLIASLNGVDISAELEKASAISSAPASAPAEEKKEEKKEEKPVESAAGLASLFG